MLKKLLRIFTSFLLIFFLLLVLLPDTLGENIILSALKDWFSSRPLYAQSASELIMSPPYKNISNTWENTLAAGWAYGRTNYLTGFIWTSGFSYMGGASAEADHFVDVEVPSGYLSEVSVEASIIYTGGSQKVGFDASAWGGTDKVWYIGSEYHRETLDPVFGWDDIAVATADLAINLAPGVGELAGLEQTAKVMKVAEAIGYIWDAAQLCQGFYELYEAGKANKTTIFFSFRTDHTTQIGVGLRVDTSGCMLGACYTLMAGMVEYIKVYVNPVPADGYWSFNSWAGVGSIMDDSGAGNHATANNGVASVSSSRYQKGVKLDGVDDWIELGFDFNEKEALSYRGTIEAWIKPEKVANALIFWAGSGSNADGWGPEQELHLATNQNGRFNFAYYGSNTYDGHNKFYRYVSFGSYSPNVWYHVAVTYENCLGGEIKCYINGQPVEPYVSYRPNDYMTAQLSFSNVRLGKAMTGANMFKGELDEVRVYSRVLSDREIRFLAWHGIDVTPPPAPNLVIEPELTPGEKNMVSCSQVIDSESGTWMYCFEISDGATSSYLWSTSPSCLFENLQDGKTYTYRVKAKDFSNNESGWSNSVSSKQDATAPLVASMTDGCIVAGYVQNDQIKFDFPLGAYDASGIISVYTENTVEHVYNFSEPYPLSVPSVELSIPLYNGSNYIKRDPSSTGGNITGRVTDAAGNSTNFSMDRLRLDYQSPLGSVSIAGGAAFTHSQTVNLNLSYLDPDGWDQIIKVRFSNDGTNWSAWENAASIRENWILSDGYGYKIVYAQYKDSFNHLSSVCSDAITYGPVPSGGILINNDDTYTTSATVNLTLEASNVTQMIIWEGDPTSEIPSTGWEAYQSSRTFILSEGDGEKTVCVQFRTSLGEKTSVYYDSIIMDTLAPQGSVLINAGTARINTGIVTLSLTAGDSTSGVKSMRFDNGDGKWSEWESFDTFREWQLLSGEGSKTVRAQFMDYAGNISDFATATVYVDLMPPFGNIIINDGEGYTGSTSIRLNASIVGTVYDSIRQFSPVQGYMGWYYYRSPQPGVYEELAWDRTVGEVEQPYFSWNSGKGQDDNYLQITSPEHGSVIQTGEGEKGNVAIAWCSGSEKRTVKVTVELWAKGVQKSRLGDYGDGVYFSLFRNNGRLLGPVHIYRSDALPLGELSCHGLFEVDVKLDVGDVIYFYLDRGQDAFNDVISYRFTLTESEGDNVYQVRVANLLRENINLSKFLEIVLQEGSFWESSRWWEALQGIEWSEWYGMADFEDVGWQIPSGEGTKIILAQFMDGAGNISHPERFPIVLDQTPPFAGAIEINNGAQETSSAEVNLNLFAADNHSPVTEMKISENGSEGIWEPYTTQKTWYLSGTGIRTLEVFFKDYCGNISTPTCTSIFFDSLFRSSGERIGGFDGVNIGDVTGDGNNDLVLVSGKGTGSLVIGVNSGSGNFEITDDVFRNEYGETMIVDNVYKTLLADLNNDSYLDIIILPQNTATGAPVRVFRNCVGEYFVLSQEISDITEVFEGITGDLDNDGDIDLVLSGVVTGGDQSRTAVVGVYQNNNGRLSLDTRGGFIECLATALAIADINGDSFLDLLVGRPQLASYTGDLLNTTGDREIVIYSRSDRQYQQAGVLQDKATVTGRFPLVLCDLDGDYDLDIIAGGHGTTTWINCDNGIFESMPFTPYAGYVCRQIIPVDIDNDGIFDLIMGKLVGEYIEVNIGFSWGYINNEGGISGELYPVKYECQSMFGVGDLNGDNRPDLILGCLVGESSEWFGDLPAGKVLFNNGVDNEVPPTPYNLRTLRDGSEVTFSWDAPEMEEQLTYNFRVGTVSGGNDICSGVVPAGSGNAGPGLSRVLYLPDGRYYWSVQSVDGGFVHSEWAEEQLLIVDTVAPRVPSCLSPADNSTDMVVDTELVCTEVLGTDESGEYLFQIAEDKDFTINVRESNWLSENRWLVTGLKYGTTYFWRVKARDGSCNETGFCDSFSFTTIATPITVWNLPRQYSGVQGQDNWYYYAHKQNSELTESNLQVLQFDNYVPSWGNLNRVSWNGDSGYLEIVGRDLQDWKRIGSGGASGWLHPGEYNYNNVAIVWQAPLNGRVYIKGMLNTGNPDSTATSNSDDGVYFSIYHGMTLIAGPERVFRGNSEDNRIDYAYLETCALVNEGDKIYFYVDRGNWQDSDMMYYSFSVSYDPEADLEAPVSRDEVGENWLALFAEDTGSGVAKIEYCQYYPAFVDWQEYTGTVVLQPGEYRFMYRAIDNNGNVEPYHRVSVNATAPVVYYSLEVQVSGGGRVTVNPSQQVYLSNTSVELTAESDSGWVFAGWRGDVNGLSNTISITMIKNLSITAEFVQLGDANGDRQVDILDLTRVAREILGLTEETPGADANNDGFIDVLDMTRIVRLILELES